MAIKVVGFRRTASFDADVKRAPPDVVQDAKDALDLLMANPSSNRLRLHSMPGFPKPTIYKIDVRPDKSWQLTFELDAQVAVLLRLGTHRHLDRRPR